MSGTTRVSSYQKGKTRKVKTNLDLLEQEIVSGSGICWAICKSAPHPRQPRQHPTTQFLQAGCPSCHPTNSVKALKATTYTEYCRYCTELILGFFSGFFTYTVPEKTQKKTQDEFNAVTAVLSSTHHRIHQGCDFTRTFAKLCKP